MPSVIAGPKTRFIRVTPAVSAAPDYTIDDVLGTVMTITSPFRGDGAAGLLQSVVMTCLADIPSGVVVDVLFFDQSPVNSTFTDNAVLAVNASDLPFYLGAVRLETRIDLGTPAAIQATLLGLPVQNAAGQNKLYAVAVVRGASTLNLGTVADIVFMFGFLQD